MKYTRAVEINQPINRVIELFDNPDNLPKWQAGLQRFERLSGTPGQPGAKSRLHYKMGKRDVEMIETITVRNLPHEFSGTYEAKGVWNNMVNRFIELSPTKTRWIAEAEFRMSGLMWLIGLLFASSFKKETERQMAAFKTFAEQQG